MIVWCLSYRISIGWEQQTLSLTFQVHSSSSRPLKYKIFHEKLCFPSTFLSLRWILFIKHVPVKLSFTSTFYFFHHFFLSLPMLVKLLAWIVIMFSLFLSLHFIVSQFINFWLKLFPKIFIDILIVLAEGLQRIKYLWFESQRNSPGTVSISK